MLIRDLSPQALLLAHTEHRSIAQALEQVRQAEVIVIATPIYKAAYSGVLKVFLDLLPQDAFKGKTVLPLCTGGSPHHMLALDYALRPVLQSLGAQHIEPGVYAADFQVARLPQGGYSLANDLRQRLDAAVDALPVPVGRHRNLAKSQIAGRSVHFSRVRCSV